MASSKAKAVVSPSRKRWISAATQSRDFRSRGFIGLKWPTGSMPDAAPNGANQRRTTIHCTNSTAVCTTSDGVPAWMLDSAGMGVGNTRFRCLVDAETSISLGSDRSVPGFSPGAASRWTSAPNRNLCPLAERVARWQTRSRRWHFVAKRPRSMPKFPRPIHRSAASFHARSPKKSA